MQRPFVFVLPNTVTPDPPAEKKKHTHPRAHAKKTQKQKNECYWNCFFDRWIDDVDERLGLSG